MGKRVAIYARVSTDRQTVENQIAELQAVAGRLDWNVVAIYTDEGISGTKGRDQRPAFDRLIKAAVRREIDLIAAWSVDRLGRSLQDLVGFLNEIQSRHVDLYLHQQGIDSSTPAGRALFGMLGVFSEFEVAMTRSRVRLGLERAKAQGKRLGRPPMSPGVVRRVEAGIREGKSLRQVGRDNGVSVTAVMKVRDGMKDGDAENRTVAEAAGAGDAGGVVHEKRPAVADRSRTVVPFPGRCRGASLVRM